MSTASSELNGDARRAELAANLAEVRKRIDAACAAAGRPAADVTLIAISKTRPASDVRLLAGLGLTDFGENRDQEAAPKAADSADLPITWHFVGQLQTNKAASVVRYADVVHSVDRVRLVRALGGAVRAAGRADGRELTGLVQVRLDDDPARGGVPPGGVGEIAEAIAAEPGLVLGGVMAVAPLGMAPDAAFGVLRECSDAVRRVRPDATVISAGMSGDLEPAILSGSTHIRIGTALLGARTPPVR
ncbi:MAG TPA: YggS family pyridoxal phosphate-dependent enzyme [Trebonia sp.]|jgi:pyridoxal phosphate enzyme (YggS family)|nr:YggS family pyridoxal phosphate-dependent enzyme [Trebonia sp.]